MLVEVWVVLSVVYGVFSCRFEVGGVGSVVVVDVCYVSIVFVCV